MTALAKIPFHGSDMLATLVDGVPHVALKPVCEAIGLDYSGQLQRLKRQPWATVGVIPTVAEDGKTREMSMLDRRAFTMWLATVDTGRVKSESARELLGAYQCEAADALDAYFHEGAAVNPRADEHQLQAAMLLAQSRLELCKAAQGLIHPDHLEARARVILAQGLGEHAELDAVRRPLYTQDFLKGKNLSAQRLRSVSGTFGKRVKKAFIAEYGREPKKYPVNVANGQTREAYAYTEADRPLLEKVWEGMEAARKGHALAEVATLFGRSTS